MVFDAIVAAPGALGTVDRLTSARRLELLAAQETIAEVARTPDRAHRRMLQRVRVLVVPPPHPRDGTAQALLGRLQACTGVSRDDARIAVAAALQEVPLVTEDRDLRLAAAEHLPHVPLWRWAADLEPRIAALGAELPGPLRAAGRRR